MSTLTLDSLYKKYYNELSKYLTFKFDRLNSFEIEEVLSSTFIKLNNKLETFDENRSSIKTFIYTIAINKDIDYIRTSKIKNNRFVDIDFKKERVNSKDEVHVQMDDIEGTFFNIPDSEVINIKSEKKHSYKALLNLIKENLNTEDFRLFSLKYIWGLKFEEISNLEGSNLSTIKVKIMKIKKKLCLIPNIIFHSKNIY